MLFGLMPPYRAGVTADPAWMSAYARQAEAVGFESIYTVEHVAVGAGYASRYPYSSTGRMPLPEDAEIPDPLDTLAFIAGVTSTLRLGTGIVVLPTHHPVQLAKRVATIDRLSAGRVTLGVGIGWQAEEMEALGVDPSTRGARTDECIAAMRVLWSEREATFEGRHFRFERLCSFPKPVQQDGQGVPIHVAGHSPAAARRAGRLGNGFHPLGLDDDTVRDRLAIMRAAADDAGRDPGSIELTLGMLLDLVDDDRLARAEQLGATRFVLSTRTDDIDAACEELAVFAGRFGLKGAA